MSRNGTKGALATAGKPTTVEEALGPFTTAAIDGTKDAATRKTLTELFAVARGLAGVVHSDDPQDQAVAGLLKQVGVGPGDVQQMVKLGMNLIAQSSERESAKAAYDALAARCEAMRVKTHDATVSFSNLARAKIGAQSPFLERFGIKILGGRKGVKRAKKPAETPTDPQPGTTKS